jgi:hypothetical protein
LVIGSTESTMAKLRSTLPHDKRTVADDETLLDEFVEAALVEAGRDAEAAALLGEPGEADSAAAFLQRAADFLNARSDRAELLEKLRASISPAPGGGKPAPAAGASPADGKPASSSEDKPE